MKSTFFIFLSVVFLSLASTVHAAGAASFTWAQNSISAEANVEKSVQLTLSTGGSNTTGADAVLKYDPTKIEITSISFSNPNLYSYNFPNNDVGSGTVKISSTFTDVASKYNGTGNYVTISFKGLQLGTSALSWSCQDGSTTDTNIMQQQTATDIVNCASLSPLSITITQATSTSTSTSTTTSNDAQGTSTNTCSALQSAPSNLVAKTQSNSSVLLTWTKDSNATSYTLKFGTAPNSYQYGASTIGNTGSFVVNYLRPSTTYYFAIAGVNVCSTSSFITASAKTSGGTTPAAPIKNTTTPSFDTLIAQTDTQNVEVVTPLPVLDERLNESAPITLGQESFLPEKLTQTTNDAGSVTSKLPLIVVAGIVAVVVGAAGVGFVFMRAKRVTPVTTVPEAETRLSEVGKSSSEIPPLGA